MDRRFALAAGFLAFALLVSVGLVAYRFGSNANSSSPEIHVEVTPERVPEPKRTETTRATPPPSSQPPAPPKPITIDDAIRSAAFADSEDGAPHPSVVKFLPWAISNLVWEDLKGPKVPHTEVQRVLRDADRERGRRICMTAMVGQIIGENVAGGRVYRGGMGNVSDGVIRFVAVGAADDVYDGKTAQFCGVVVGRESFSNASGGTTHAVRAVGMFDVPSNRKRVRAASTAAP